MQTAQAIFLSMYQMLIGWSKQEPTINRSVHHALSEMISNYSNPKFSVATLLENSHYTADHFRRMFKKETGKTPTAYLLDLRIHHAKKLLQQKNDTGYLIKDIAMLSGFRDPYYFSRLFKERVGVSPASFE